MKTRFLLAGMIAVTLAWAVPRLAAQATAQKTAGGNVPTLTLDEALPLTCEQAWVAGGKSYQPMMAIVKTLAKASLANRNLTFPNTREAGIGTNHDRVADEYACDLVLRRDLGACRDTNTQRSQRAQEKMSHVGIDPHSPDSGRTWNVATVTLPFATVSTR